MKFVVKPGYKGMCARCMKNDGTIEEWVEFQTPIPANESLNLPEVKGCWQYICERCSKYVEPK